MSPIEQLADLVGFHQSYTNSFGDQVYATNESRYALLEAMGFDVTSDESINQATSQLANKPWLTLLPDTHIVKAELLEYSLPISYESNLKDQKISWLITTENNEQIKGSHLLGTLAIDQEHTIDHHLYYQSYLPIPKLEEGYHKIDVKIESSNIQSSNIRSSNIKNQSQFSQKDSCYLIVAPKTCYGPKDAANYKMWGLAAQLYSLKSDKSWGLGDFSDLKSLVVEAAKKGASCIGLNPLHPLFPGNTAHRSPYSPTSRNFLNTIYIDVHQVPNFEDCKEAIEKVNSKEFQQSINQVNRSELIDYQHSAWLKYQILELLYADFIKKHINKNSDLAKEYCDFVERSGTGLKTLATFDALYEYFRAKDKNSYGWTDWPTEYQTPSSKAVAQFQKQYADRVGYFQFIQWIADRQLHQVEMRAKEEGMAIGLYLDLAVGCDGAGADVWADRDTYVSGGAVGAPPDATNLLGQDWGLTPINPLALKRKGFKPFIQALRGNMIYAGALRIDHVLGYMRQYWVAPGKKADEGIYITFPFEDMLRVIALESRRAKCIVIGEDLGTTPDGFGEIMASAGLLSYRVLFFERWEDGLFQRPENYPEQSMVTVSTHDLPTLAGWWTGNDLAWREKLDLYPTQEMGQSDRDNRITDREQLVSALIDMKVIDETKIPEKSPAKMNQELANAVQEFLAKAPSRIQLIPLEDALGMHEQVNIPGTIDEHPNWLQRLPFNMNKIWLQNDMKNLLKTMAKERNRL